MPRNITSLMSSLLAISCCCAIPDRTWALAEVVNTNADSGPGSLRAAITAINSSADPTNTITFTNAVTTINLASSLPPINLPLTTQTLDIDGGGGVNTTINGASNYRVFFIQNSSINNIVSFENLTITNAVAIGGAGGSNAATNPAGGGGGGGGMGAGGGLFVSQGVAAITNVTFNTNKAQGGAGGAGGLFAVNPSPSQSGGGGGGGGGGMVASGGVGGTHVLFDLSGGGGGGGGGSASGAAGGNGTAGTKGGDGGAGGGTNGGAAVVGTENANAPAGNNGTGPFGGGGGGAGAATNAVSPFNGGNGGAGGDFSGGGGSGGGTDTGNQGLGGMGGTGGFGGGGGGSATNQSGGMVGGTGGFGGGGGGGGGSGGGTSIFGGGTGAPGFTANGGGGGGAGLGGAIFVRQGAQLNVFGAQFPGTSTVAGGAGGNGAIPGTALGPEIFLMSGGTLTFKLNTTLTIGTAIQADGLAAGGGLNQLGPGTLNLTGANTYTGGTTVSGGILQGNSTSLQGPITNDASVVFAQTGTGTYAGLMSGTGALTLQGGGTLILSGANTYSGGTTVTATTLQGDATSIQGPIVNNGTVVFTQAGTGTYAGAMSGAGSLVMQGTGILILTGPNTYSNGTLVATGILQGNTTSLQGNIENDFGVIFNQTGIGTYSGVMSGIGTLGVEGGGTLTLAGANTYSGGTVVTAGTLVGNTTSLQGPILNNATVVFNQASNGTYSGVLSGIGTVITEGVGASIFTGASTMTGFVDVVQGTLLVDNSLPSAFTVDPGATLGGTGPVASIVNSGFVAPGNSIGVLSVTGNYVQNPTGTLEIEIANNGTSDQLAVGGTATLSGTLELFPDPGPYLKGIVYDVVTAQGGVLGTFDTVTFVTSPVPFQLTYLPNAVQLAVLNSTIFVGQTIHGHNANQVANYLEGLTYTNNTDLFTTVLTLAELTNPALSNALDQLHPAPTGSFEMINSFQNSFLSTLFTEHPLECCSLHSKPSCFCGNPLFWVTPFIFRTNQDNAEGVAGFHTKSHGLATGFDYCWETGCTLGGGIAYSYTEFAWNRNRGHGHIQSGILCLYTGWCKDNYDIEASLLGEINWYDASRTIMFPGIQRTAKNFHRGDGWTLHLGGGYDWNTGPLYVRPFAKLDYSYLYQDRYREHGAQSLDLVVEQKSSSILRSEAGVNLTKTFSWQHKGWVTPTLSLSWVGETPFSDSKYRATLEGAGGCFTVRSFHKMRNRFSPGASITLAPYHVLAITFNYSAEISGEFLGQKGDIRIERGF